MSHRSRCDAFGRFYLDFRRDDAGNVIPRSVEDLQRFETDLRVFMTGWGFTVRSLGLDVKEGRYVAPPNSMKQQNTSAATTANPANTKKNAVSSS